MALTFLWGVANRTTPPTIHSASAAFRKRPRGKSIQLALARNHPSPPKDLGIAITTYRSWCKLAIVADMPPPPHPPPDQRAETGGWADASVLTKTQSRHDGPNNKTPKPQTDPTPKP